MYLICGARWPNVFLNYNVLEQFEDEWGARGVFNMSEEGKASIVIQKGIVFPVKH